MSEIVCRLSEMTDKVPEGITFSLSGYESVTGQWTMDFHAMDSLNFLPVTDTWTYRVYEETFVEDIENNIEKFIKTYNERVKY